MMTTPLITGNDLRTMNANTQKILTNAEIIAVDQDPLGKQGAPLPNADKVLEIWSKPIVGGNTFAVALFNRSAAAADITLNLADLGIPSGHLRDLSTHTDLGCFAGSYTSKAIPSHGVRILTVTSDCCTP